MKRRIPYAFISAYLTDFITRIDSRMMSQYALLTRHKHQLDLFLLEMMQLLQQSGIQLQSIKKTPTCVGVFS